MNDLDEPSIRLLTRQQVWQGLLLRARDPGKFNESLISSLSDESDEGFTRTIIAGEAQFFEQVTLVDEQEIHTQTRGDNPIAAESITRIEEPAEGSLFVRFIYRRDLDQTDDDVNIAEYLKSAYVQMDIEAIAQIRVLANREFLAPGMN